jgi:WS/DGAT/MGAT family acyltransferase
MYWSERLSYLDATFLYFEDRTAHMHVGSVALFDGAPPSYESLYGLIAARLSRVPRYRQRLATVPFELGRPVWVDDADFDLSFHLRHAALPAPGGQAELDKLAGQLFSQRLDRHKPLWEMWLIEGLGANRFALLAKTHHCMIDGISGMDIASVLLDHAPNAAPPSPPEPWSPRPVPTRARLLADALRDQVKRPFSLARQALEPATEGRRFLLEVGAGVRPLLGLARMGQAPPSPINRPIGPHRRWATRSFDLGTVKRVRAALGGTVNDVLLAVVAGALRRQLLARGEGVPAELRIMVPVSVRTAEGRGMLGNQVTAIFSPLPVGEADARARLARISQSMRGLKESKQAVGALALSRLGEFAPPTLVAQASRLEMMHHFMNLVVTNVPGPQAPLYLLGRPMAACHPAVPLARNQTLSVALLSYNGRVDVGLLGDHDAFRDLGALAAEFEPSLAELVALADRAELAGPAGAPAGGVARAGGP